MIHHGKHHQAYINNLNAALEAHPDLQARCRGPIGDLNACPRRSAPPSG
jgi:Fe-Mn family superoxide dismutase